MHGTTIAARLSAPGSRGSAGHRQVTRVPVLRRLIAWFSNERRIRRGIDELMALDDRMLSDIGLTRGSIEHAARYGTYGRTMFTDGLAAQPTITPTADERG
jgi:uncharacterized protein YjiS (DUF1127 family)